MNNNIDKKTTENTSLVQTAVNQSYEQYINPPDAELHRRLGEMKKALQKKDQQPNHVFTIPNYEDSNYPLKVRIRELEEQIVTYCRENPSAEEWFGITVKRDNNNENS